MTHRAPQLSLLLRRYGVPGLLGASLLVQVFGPRASQALNLPSQRFTALQDLGAVADQLRDTPAEAQDITQGLVDQQLAARGIEGSIDVEAVVERGDLSSVVALEELNPDERIALVNNTRVIYEESASLVDRAKLLSSRAAAIHQPADSEGGGFSNAVTSALSNSTQDLMTDFEQYSSVLDKTQSQLEKIEKLWKGLGIILNAKPAFLPEKTDSDYFVVCVNYVAGGQLYPQLISSSFGSFAELAGNYSSVLGQVTTSIQRRANVTERLTDMTSTPLSAVEVAVRERGDYGKLLEAGRASIGKTSSQVAGQITQRYGGSLAAAGALSSVAAQMRQGGDIGATAGALAAAQGSLTGDIGARNAALVQGLASGEAGSAEALAMALGPEGAALLQTYRSLDAVKDRASDQGVVEATKEQLRAQMLGQLEASKQQYAASIGAASQLAESFKGKSPDELLTEANQAAERVEHRASDNLDNSTSLVTRLTDRKNYGETFSTYLDQWKDQEKDFQYLTALSRLLDYQSMIKPPTT